jgi:predicted ribosome-associated RNA-binding protein Tma20
VSVLLSFTARVPIVQCCSFACARNGPTHAKQIILLFLVDADPIMMPRLQVDKGAIRFVLSGANIMCRGLTSAGGKVDIDLPEGAPVVRFRASLYVSVPVSASPSLWVQS